MKLILERIFTCPTYTIGKLYIDGVYECDTIEDTDRGLNQDMEIDEIKKLKIYGETAIPTGTYEITMNVKSPKFSNFTKYKWAKPYNGYIPRLLNVKGFDGILIHVSNTAQDVFGCIGVGKNKANGKVIESTATFNLLMPKLQEANKNNEKIEIEIKTKYKK